MATPLANSVPLTGNPLIDGLVQGSSWQFGGGPHVLTYSFSNNDTPNGGPWTFGLSTAFTQALREWANVANITFVEQGSGGVFTQSTADIAAALTGTELEQGFDAVSLGIFPDSAVANLLISGAGYNRTTYPHPEGDVFFDNFAPFIFTNVGSGGRGFEFFLHELGHALGLKHPHDDGSNDRPNFASLGLSGYDNTHYTVMSYNDYLNGYAATPMLFDIAAIQSIYGANMSYHTGNDIYRLLFWSNTIWDAGGIDTLDASNMNSNVTIDLREGMLSNVFGNSNAVTAIAYGVTIENAIGTFGNDMIFGNGADNNIDGGGGIDTMTGGLGSDTYLIDNYSDVVVENPFEGMDVVQSTTSFALPANVENLFLIGSGNDNGAGNDVDNFINGNASANILGGAGGNDTLNGGAGPDALYGGPGNDILDGGAGIDLLAGGVGNDTYLVSDLIPPTVLMSHGDAGDYITMGQSYLYGSDDGTFNITVADSNHDGLVDFFALFFLGNVAGNFANLNLSTSQLGQNFVAGTTYLDATRGSVNHPQLDFSLNGRGSNMLTGSFMIVNITADTSGPTPVLLSFSATFEQHSEGAIPASYSTFSYNYGGGVADSITELPNEGTDTVQTSVDGYVLPANVENLMLTGSGNLNGTGNNLDNILTSNSGIDTLIGGLGNDTYFLNNAADVVIENPSEGTDTVVAGFSYSLAGTNLENVTLTGNAALTATGNALDNVLTSNTGVNTLTGGLGNDIYVLSNAADSVMENPGEGTDTVQFAGNFNGISFVLPANVENAINIGSVSLTVTGNSLGNTLIGGAGAEIFNGMLGNDTLNGNDGFDIATYSGSKGSYTITPNLGIFAVNGPDGNDTVSGVEKLIFGDGSVKLLGSVAHGSGNDLIGNGFGDVLWRSDSGAVALWALNGATITGGGFVNGGTALTPDWNIAGISDFNGDGRGDILWRNDDGRVAEWNMNGLTVAGGGFVNGGAAVTLAWQIAGVGDFNGDHKADILWHGSDGVVGLWQMDGPNITGGGFVNGGTLVSMDWSVAGVADFSGDGKADILWRNVDGRIAEWTMNGLMVAGGGFVNGGASVTPDWTIAGVGDFSGDHKADILWQNTDGRVGLWQMDGANLVLGGFANGGTPVIPDWHIAGVGDFSGDGRSDILWRNDDGRIAEWNMNGTTIVGGGFVNNSIPVAADWIVS